MHRRWAAAVFLGRWIAVTDIFPVLEGGKTDDAQRVWIVANVGLRKPQWFAVNRDASLGLRAGFRTSPRHDAVRGGRAAVTGDARASREARASCVRLTFARS